MNPWTGTWARRLPERVLAERVLAVLLSLRRAAGVGAVRRVLLVSLLLAALLRRAVPRPAGSARGHPRLRPAVAGAAVALTREPWCAVTVRRAASWSRGERDAARGERGAREPRSGPPAGTGSAAALATVLSRPGAAAVWPGAGVGIRLPAPPP